MSDLVLPSGMILRPLRESGPANANDALIVRWAGSLSFTAMKAATASYMTIDSEIITSSVVTWGGRARTGISWDNIQRLYNPIGSRAPNPNWAIEVWSIVGGAGINPGAVLNDAAHSVSSAASEFAADITRGAASGIAEGVGAGLGVPGWVIGLAIALVALVVILIGFASLRKAIK